MFKPMNSINLGVMQGGREVKDVELPKWAKNDPYRYVYELKKLLESDQVSASINKWIDYIYGYKQRGKEAVKSINVFPHYTYDNSMIDRDTDDSTKDSISQVSISQAYNYGQTPAQLFKEAHKMRKSRSKAIRYNLITDFEASVRPYRPVDNQRNVVIFYSKFVDSKILTLTRERTIKSFNLKSKTHQSNPNSPFTIEASFEKNLPAAYVQHPEN